MFDFIILIFLYNI